ncbi:response regulator [Bradyrhizobium sp. 157]|nr:response regulator [Bradyrhizobium sp. 157]
MATSAAQRQPRRSDDMELLRQLNTGPRKLPVIVMTGHGDVPLAVEAMKLGALDCLEKPFEDDRLIAWSRPRSRRARAVRRAGRCRPTWLPASPALPSVNAR